MEKENFVLDIQNIVQKQDCNFQQPFLNATKERVEKMIVDRQDRMLEDGKIEIKFILDPKKLGGN